MVPVTTNQYINPHVSRLDGWLYPHQYIHHMDIVIYLDNSLGMFGLYNPSNYSYNML